MSLINKWLEVSTKKKSQLCINLDPAEHDLRSKQSIPKNQDKFEWCKKIVAQVAPYSSAIKINRQYIRDFSEDQTKQLVHYIRDHDLLCIDDSKLTDISSTNLAAFYHLKKEGFDATTFCPFAGNIAEATDQAHKYNLGLIVLVIMSNPQFEVIKNATINNKKAYQYFAEQAVKANADGIVLGAPSVDNHINENEIKDTKNIINDKLILVPGLGEQQGDLNIMKKYFGKYCIYTAGRSLIYSEDPGLAARRVKI